MADVHFKPSMAKGHNLLIIHLARLREGVDHLSNIILGLFVKLSIARPSNVSLFCHLPIVPTDQNVLEYWSHVHVCMRGSYMYVCVEVQLCS